MKKILTLLSLVAIVALGGCSSTVSKTEDVADKVASGQELNEDDFMVIADYVNTALDDAEKTQQELGQLNFNNSQQYKDAANELHTKYPHLSTLGKELFTNPAGKNLSEEGKEKVMAVLSRMATIPSVLLYNNQTL